MTKIGNNMSAEGKEVKVVYIDGNLNTGPVRSIRGKIIGENDMTITVDRHDGTLTIGKHFLIKIEQWKSVEGCHDVER